MSVGPHQPGRPINLVDCWKCANLYETRLGDSNSPTGRKWLCSRASELKSPPSLADGDPSFRECALYRKGTPRARG